MAACALLEDALAFGALSNLPGAPAADLTISPQTSIAVAPSVHSRNGRFVQQFFKVQSSSEG